MKHLSSLAARCAALALAGCLALTGCSAPSSSAPASSSQPASSGSQPVEEPDTLRVGYSISGGFNPYVTNDLMVLQVSDLVSEKLVEITPEMQLDYRVASSIVSSGQTVTIQLRSGLYFADGAPITAEDVAASINAARASAAYSGSLAHVTDLQVQGDQIILTLSRPDSLFAWLCALPVVKAAEVSATQPTASGRYTYGADNTLVPNSYSQFASEGAPQTIELVDAEPYTATALDVTELLGTEELIDHQNELVQFKGLTVEAAGQDDAGNDVAFLYNWDGSGTEGDDLYFNVSYNGETYTFTVESYLCDSSSEVYNAVKNLEIGQTVDLEGFLYWYEGVNPHITSVTVVG